jgi:hypothetical protein
MLPHGQGGMIYLDYDYQDQNYNWSGSSRAPAANNDDKNIRTNFITLGAQYMFNRSWGIQAEMPYDFRHFVTLNDSGNLAMVDWGAQGDARIEGIYTGFFPDMSVGLLFGLKLPTGNFTHEDAGGDVDRDSEIGTGSTDILLGGFFRSPIFNNNNFNFFAQLNTDFPVLTQAGYRPGMEFDESAGLYYTLPPLGSLRISPVAQILASERTSDSGVDASSPTASGYTRLLLSPGIEFDLHPVELYADVEFPVYQHMTGNQLVAPALFKVSLSYHF